MGRYNCTMAYKCQLGASLILLLAAAASHEADPNYGLTGAAVSRQLLGSSRPAWSWSCKDIDNMLTAHGFRSASELRSTESSSSRRSLLGRGQQKTPPPPPPTTSGASKDKPQWPQGTCQLGGNTNRCATPGGEKYCISGVGCIKAKYNNALTGHTNMDAGVAVMEWESTQHSNEERDLGHGGYGVFPSPWTIQSRDGRCSAKFAFRRFTSPAPYDATIWGEELGESGTASGSTMDVTAHILEASICDIKKDKCSFQKATLGCYVWAFGKPNKHCDLKLWYGVTQ